MGYGISYQRVGINRCGRFLQPCRTKGPGRSPTASAGGAPALRNEVWRRVSDLVGANAESNDHRVRRRGAKRLVAWIEKRVVAERAYVSGRNLKKFSLTDEWAGDVDGWKRVACGGRSVESYCAQLGMSRARLTLLFQETLGISARDVVDGFKIRGLRKYVVGQLREAALRLWGPPGEFAKRRCMRDLPHPTARSPFHGEEANGGGRRSGGSRSRNGGRDAPYGKRSRYFRSQPTEFFGVDDWTEEQLRVSELLGKLEELREENEFSMEAFVLRLGFETRAAFRAACLNVTGLPFEFVERSVAREIVAYYLAAEDREMRELCLRDDLFGFRARELYCGDAEKIPAAPFCDRWSALEFAKPAWVEKMRSEFG